MPLSGGFSGAVDKRYITLGAPLFVATIHPETRGYGDNAGQSASKMKDKGYVWMLLPNGMLPEYHP